ncbi:hypothetical protein Bxe_C1352 [Paraburkholderia xenovorans LB400]|uniref:Uncharacterized protein n=1 Tax=Paraburkholderia xenovorans (strain LB400) TaxID=266265 RepID=Q13FD7_PARXL|nr:hypothetical protein Bxe_C1352 [Paraburkholderia xenovorans LB400]
MFDVSLIRVKAPGMIAVVASVRSVVERGFERRQECVFLRDFATVISPFFAIGFGLRKLSPSLPGASCIRFSGAKLLGKRAVKCNHGMNV